MEVLGSVKACRTRSSSCRCPRPSGPRREAVVRVGGRQTPEDDVRLLVHLHIGPSDLRSPQPDHCGVEPIRMLTRSAWACWNARHASSTGSTGLGPRPQTRCHRSRGTPPGCSRRARSPHSPAGGRGIGVASMRPATRTILGSSPPPPAPAAPKCARCRRSTAARTAARCARPQRRSRAARTWRNRWSQAACRWMLTTPSTTSV